jgi:hypothetical protein
MYMNLVPQLNTGQKNQYNFLIMRGLQASCSGLCQQIQSFQGRVYAFSIFPYAASYVAAKAYEYEPPTTWAVKSAKSMDIFNWQD